MTDLKRMTDPEWFYLLKLGDLITADVKRIPVTLRDMRKGDLDAAARYLRQARRLRRNVEALLDQVDQYDSIVDD